MTVVRLIVAVAAGGIAFAAYSSCGIAQQVTGELGSPGATTTIGGQQLPSPDPKFGGMIKQKASESKAWWAPRLVPPKGAPNVLLIMTDDVGFGAPGTFGGVVPTPALDRIAKNGCATRTSTRRPSARRPGRRSSPAATITWPASG
jgi:arylsulfatase